MVLLLLCFGISLDSLCAQSVFLSMSCTISETRQVWQAHLLVLPSGTLALISPSLTQGLPCWLLPLQVPQISVLEQELAVKAAKAKADMQAAAAAADMQQFAGVQPTVITQQPLRLPPPPDVS